MIDVIVIGHNYNTTLSIVKSLGEAGLKCATVNISNNPPGNFVSIIRKIKSPVLSSKHINQWGYARKEPNSAFVEDLIRLFGNKSQKPLLLPSGDYYTLILDEYRELLSEYFHIPHLINNEKMLRAYMDKERQKVIAHKHNIAVAQNWSVIIKKGCIPNIPNDIKYPCIAKPQTSTTLPKSFIQRCINREELSLLLQKISSNYSCCMLVEEFIEVDEEFTIPGISDGEEVLIPSFIKKTVVASGAHKGVTISGIVENASTYKEIQSKLISLMKEIGFSGIFDIELLRCNNKFFLNEINFRNGAAAYSLTMAGVNLQAIYANHILHGAPMMLDDIEPKSISFTNDKAALDYFVDGYSTWAEYQEQLKSVDVLFIDNKNDRGAQAAFRIQKIICIMHKILNRK